MTMLKPVNDTFNIDDFRWAVEQGYWNTIELMLGGSKLLHMAVYSHIPEVIEILLDHNLDVNDLLYEQTPLDVAIETDDNDIAAILVSHGGKTSYQYDPSTVTPLDSAQPTKTCHNNALFNGNGKQRFFRKCLRNRDKKIELVYKFLNNGELDVIKCLVKAGLNLRWNCKYHNNTALELAVKSGSCDLIIYLLKTGAKLPKRSTEYCCKLLEAAAESMSAATLNLLVTAGLPLYNTDIENWNIWEFPWQKLDDFSQHTFLHQYVTPNDNVLFIKELVKLGVNKDKLLLKACEYRLFEVINWLISIGANVNTVDIEGRTPLIRLFSRNNSSFRQFKQNERTPLKIVDLLITHGADINHKSETGTALGAALYSYNSKKDLDIIKYLLSKGADAKLGVDILHAVEQNDIDLVRVLLDAGVNVNQSNEYGESVYNYARMHGYTDIVELFEEHGAIVPQVIENDLQAAIYWNNTEEALKLIRSGVNLEELNSNYETPLLAAITSWGNVEIIEELLNNGANLEPYQDAWNSIGNPLDQAIQMVRTDIVKLLLEHGAVRRPSVIYKALPPWYPFSNKLPEDELNAYHYDIMKLLLDAGGSPNLPPSHFGMPLHQAVSLNKPDIVTLFLDYGADIDAIGPYDDFSDDNPLTPLGAALLNHHYDIANILIERQANVNIRNSNGISPLMALLDRNEDMDAIYMVEKLIMCGADVNACDKKGKSVLDYAQLPEFKEILRNACATK